VHLPIEEREGKTVAIIRMLYLTPIVLVIGSIVVHNGLDFIRKSNHVLRRD
jgi:hypothetical protein